MASNSVRSGGLLRRVLLPLGVAASLVAGGCALSPQTVPIQPSLSVDATNIGQGRSVALDAVDNRTDKTIGSRGGVYESVIRTGSDITAGLRTAMADALTTQGFVVVDASASADLRMQVGLDALTYATHGAPVARTVEIVARVVNTVQRESKTYTGRAGITKSRNVLRIPAPEDNEAHINDTLALALEKLLADQRYIDFVR